jgi:hypothetical protein
MTGCERVFYVIPLLALSLLAAVHMQAEAQRSPPSRTVYRCEEGGKVIYSDAPCLGAKRVDIQPTRGLNKISGSERIGADVRAEQNHEQMANALRPIFGESAAERAVRHKRARLSPEKAHRCYELDREIAQAEQREIMAKGADLKSVQSELLVNRQSFHRMGC